jgi:hypothetical protein
VDSDQSKSVKAGYRSVGVLFVIGFACIGFTRLEDRAIIGPPSSPANAMSAFVAADQADGAEDESYSEPPEEVLGLERARQAPVSRIRRIVRAANVPSVAARQILGPPPSTQTQVAGGSLQPDALPAVVSTLSAIESSAPTFAALAPPLPGTGTPVFAADGTPGNGGGGGGGGGVPTDPAAPATPVPEPSTWLMLVLGLFGIGAAIRHHPVNRRALAASISRL